MWPSVPEQLQLLDDASGAILVMILLFVGEFGQTAGWRIRRCRAFNTARVGVDTTSRRCSWRVGIVAVRHQPVGHHHQDAHSAWA
jgi:hypothetical protein